MVDDGAHDRLTAIEGVGDAVAGRLLDRYGSADAVFAADASALRTVAGVGATVAENIAATTGRGPRGRPSTDDADRAAKRELARVDGVGEAVAERLVERFGSVRAVLQADRNTLTTVSGVGPAVAGRLVEATSDRDGTILPREGSPTTNTVADDTSDGSAESTGPDEGFTVRNMVFSGDLGLELVLHAVAIDMPSATVDEGETAGTRLVYDPRDEGTVRVTEAGKLLVAGVGSEAEAADLLAAFLDDLPPVGLDDEEIDLTLTNVVATATVDNPVPLSGLANELEGDEASYDPSGFPGYSFTLPDSSCTFTLFGSGNVTITGADSVEAAKAALETLDATLDAFDPEALRTPNDATHSRVDAIAAELDLPTDAVAGAHELVDEYDAAVPGSSRGDDGKAAAALYLAASSLTQSAVADAAGVSEVTVRNVLGELRDL